MAAKLFEVTLFATLPCSAAMEVKAATAEEAKDWALENWRQFPWDGADVQVPQGADIDSEVRAFEIPDSGAGCLTEISDVRPLTKRERGQ